LVRRRRDARAATGSEAGFTVLELVVAITLFALVFAAVSLGMGGVLRVDRTNRSRSVAAYLAAKQLDTVRGLTFDQVVVGRSTQSYNDPGTTSTYSITQDVSWVSPTATSANACAAPTGSSAGLAYKRVTVQVTWPRMSGAAPVSSQTLLTPPAGAIDPYAGHIAVQLYDRSAAPLVGQTVNLGGPATATQVSNEDGCVFFAFLDAGTYTLTLSTSGYVDRQLNQPATTTVSAVAAQITKVQIDYDRAASLLISVTSPAGSLLPDAFPLTIANSNLTLGTKAFAGSGATRTISPLFPYAGGYQVWTGECADADPSFHPGGSRGPVLPTSPGGSASGTAALDAVDVIVRRGLLGTLTNNVTVVAEHVTPAGCGAVTLSSTAWVTNTSGTVRLALPYGTWRIRAPSRTLYLLSSWPTVTLDPVSTTIPSVTVRVN
jgi:type II secretory pathway pseudopilin PulG